jgi:sulfite exporter TauE/SafE
VARALAAAGKDVSRSPESGGEPLEVTYWYPYGCRDCEDFLWNDVPEMETRTGTRVEIRERNTGEPGDFEALVDELDGLGVPMRLLPVMIVGDEVFQGDREIKRGLEDVMSGNMSAEQSKNRGTVRWEPGAVFLAGLLDGVNPCAFSAMVFLVSALAVAGRSRRTMLAVGLFYALGIFITYSLVGAGLLSGIRRIAVSSGMQTWLEMILGIILGLLALLSVIDGVRLSRGRTDLLLKLPKNPLWEGPRNYPSQRALRRRRRRVFRSGGRRRPHRAGLYGTGVPADNRLDDIPRRGGAGPGSGWPSITRRLSFHS